MVLKLDGVEISTRYYHGNYEELHMANQDVYAIHYLKGGAIYVTLNGMNGQFYYTYKDYLGSLLAVTDSDGNVVGEHSFDAWGRYRNPETWVVFNSDPSEGGVFNPDVIDMPVWFSRGYTGHEHLREFDLINMNARLYDPIQGRMISPDNLVSHPDNSQGYNRYSYVLNNPLKYVDPTGNSDEHITMAWYEEEELASESLDRASVASDNPPRWWQVLIGWFTGDGPRHNPNLVDRGTDDVEFNNVRNERFLNGQGFTSQEHIGAVFSGFDNSSRDGGGVGDPPRQNPVYIRGTISEWKPTFFDRWGESQGFFGKLSYDLVDGVYVTLQSPFLAHNSVHLNGAEVSGNDRVDAFVNTASWATSFVTGPTKFKLISQTRSQGIIIGNQLGDKLMFLERGRISKYGYRYSIKYNTILKDGQEFWHHLWDWH